LQVPQNKFGVNLSYLSPIKPIISNEEGITRNLNFKTPEVKVITNKHMDIYLLTIIGKL